MLPVFTSGYKGYTKNISRSAPAIPQRGERSVNLADTFPLFKKEKKASSGPVIFFDWVRIEGKILPQKGGHNNLKKNYNQNRQGEIFYLKK